MPSQVNGGRGVSKSKTSELERIRNNQRRSRARRKEYLEELENKVRQYESTAKETLADVNFELLSMENELLKGLLRSLGLGDDFVQTYTRAAQMAKDFPATPTSSEISSGGSCSGCCQGNGLSVASQSSQEEESTSTLQTELQWSMSSQAIAGQGWNEQASLDLFQSSTQEADPFEWDAQPFPTLASFISDTLHHTNTVPVPELDGAGTGNFSLAKTSPAPSDISDTTTLCSVACSLVLKSNTKGYSLTELNVKLRAGYKYGNAPDEGCRIENKVLLRVLSEIA